MAARLRAGGLWWTWSVAGQSRTGGRGDWVGAWVGQVVSQNRQRRLCQACLLQPWMMTGVVLRPWTTLGRPLVTTTAVVRLVIPVPAHPLASGPEMISGTGIATGKGIATGIGSVTVRGTGIARGIATRLQGVIGMTTQSAVIWRMVRYGTAIGTAGGGGNATCCRKRCGCVQIFSCVGCKHSGLARPWSRARKGREQLLLCW
mmetsp:Transcript_39764/g.88386  ORF Transcript_39764/g.88386 Transcript_39764/m.88386 type:complete len:203 (-) Transcript_39764:303-911(-)